MYVFYGVLSNAIGAREREREIALQRPHAFEIDFNTRVFTAQMCTCMHVLYVCVCVVCVCLMAVLRAYAARCCTRMAFDPVCMYVFARLVWHFQQVLPIGGEIESKTGSFFLPGYLCCFFRTLSRFCVNIFVLLENAVSKFVK